MRFERLTLGETARLEGRGLHSGTPVSVAVHPGETGIWFRCGAERVEAKPDSVSDTSRCTRLGGIAVVEHLMAAFAGLGISDAEVELSHPELPGLDGSSVPYLPALRQAGFQSLGECEIASPFTRVFVHDGEAKVAVAKGNGHWRYTFVREGLPSGELNFEEPDVIAAFAERIAPARTVGFEEELPMLEKLGLGQGLDRESCVLVGKSGYLNEPRFPDEPARHKMLDLIGDLYLAGVPIGMLDVSGTRSGHKLHVEAAARLAAAVRA